MTETGLIHLKALRGLTHLDLRDTRVTDAGLAHLKNLEDLSRLTLRGSAVTDAGLKTLGSLKRLTSLELSGPGVTDAGLESIKGLPLYDLHLYDTSVTGSGLKHFRNLHSVTLAGPGATDAGLTDLGEFKRLEWLSLEGAGVTDASLRNLNRCKGLMYLTVRGTRVTAAGLAAFRAAVPGCRIEHDGGEFEPKAAADPDRVAAEWVLWCGGSVRVGGRERDIHAEADLPSERFALKAADLTGRSVPNGRLAYFAGCKGLVSLNLTDTRVRAEGLAHLHECKGLKFLGVKGAFLTQKKLGRQT